MTSIFLARHSAPIRRAGIILLLPLAIGAAGCESSKDMQGSAKVKKEEDRFRYEGVGAKKQKVLIRRKEERFKGLAEKSNDPG